MLTTNGILCYSDQKIDIDCKRGLIGISTWCVGRLVSEILLILNRHFDTVERRLTVGQVDGRQHGTKMRNLFRRISFDVFSTIRPKRSLKNAIGRSSLPRFADHRLYI